MSSEALAGAATAAILLAILAARFLRRERHAIVVSIAMSALAATLVTSAIGTRVPAVPETAVANRPIEVQTSGYVTSSSCRACHPREYATWHDSYHHTMTQRAEPKALLGAFAGVKLTRFGQTYELLRRGDEFWIDMEDPMAPAGTRGSRVQRKITMTTGSHHMQLCWYETGYTRVLGLLPFAYLRQEQEWIPRQAAFVMPPTTTITSETGQWTLVCIKCHATNGRPRADMDTSGLHGADTQVSEFGITCEACHGPGEAHVRANQNPVRRYLQHFGKRDATIVQPAALDHRRSTEVCGQCHGIFDLVLKGKPLQDFFANGYTYRPGDDLSATRPLQKKGMDEQFWPDGEPRVAGRELNGLVGSKCFERGEMSCLSCHVMHQATDDPRPRAQWADDQLQPTDDDQNCLKCHAKFAADITAHTHHPAGSDGSRCYNCHMPHSTYGLLKGVRNHRIVSPSVATTLATGRPDACSLCHLDKPLAWVADGLARWYGIKRPSLSADDQTYAAAVLWTLKGDPAQRALLAWGLGWPAARKASGEEWIAPYLAELIDDPYEAVRIIASRSLRKLPGFAGFRPDLLGAPEQRTRAKNEVLARWQQTMSGAADGQRAAVLIGPDGNLRADLFARLLAARSQRPVSLFE